MFTPNSSGRSAVPDLNGDKSDILSDDLAEVQHESKSHYHITSLRR
jgi:hypothetical protein